MFQKVFEYAGPHKKGLYVATAIVLVSVLLGVFPFVLAYQVIAPLVMGEAITASFIIQHVILVLVCLMLQALFYGWGLNLSHKAAYDTLLRLRTALQKRFEKLPLGVIQDKGTGTVKKLFVDDKGENAMMLSNLNLSSLPECNFEVRYVDSVLLNPCAEYQRLLRMGKVARIAANFSEYIANEPKVSYRDGRYFVFDGQNTIEARKTCNGGRDLPIRCKVFYGLSKEHEALLFAVQTGISSELTAGEQLRAKLVAHEENACDFVSVTEDTGVRFALDGIRAPWKIYCIRSAYYIYKSYGASLYREMLSVLVDAWGGDSDSFLSGILHGMARFLALYQGEYSRERLILRLRTVHPKTITRLAQNDTGNVADRHMKQILSIYNGAGRTHNLPCKR